MTSNTLPYKECSEPQSNWIKLGQLAETSTKSAGANVTNIVFSIPASSRIRPGSLSTDELIAKLTKSPDSAQLADARNWLADQLSSDGQDSLRALRLRKNLSQKDLAALMKTSQSHIARIEAGKANPHLDTLRKLAAALAVDINTIDQAIGRFQSLENKES